MSFLFRRRATDPAGYAVHFEHATQPLAATFLRAAADGDLALLWDCLSNETRGLLEGRYASRAGLRLALAAHVGDELGDARLTEVAAPLRSAVLAALGGVEKVNRIGVSAARLRSRTESFVLLLPDAGDATFVREEDWRPGHLLGFVYESRSWKVDLGLTATLSDEAALPDPLGGLT